MKSNFTCLRGQKGVLSQVRRATTVDRVRHVFYTAYANLSIEELVVD